MEVLNESTVTDELLVSNLKQGDTNAYRDLFEKYGKRLYYFALGYLKSPEDAEGVVQGVFTKVWEKRTELKPECSFKSYIFTIAYNLIKKTFIKRSKYKEYIKSEKGKRDFDLSTINKTDYVFLMDRLMKLVAKMPERRRMTFIKSRFESLSVKEIAKEMQISPKTVENQITLSLKFLRSNWDVENGLMGSC